MINEFIDMSTAVFRTMPEAHVGWWVFGKERKERDTVGEFREWENKTSRINQRSNIHFRDVKWAKNAVMPWGGLEKNARVDV
jgi:hypothetical protein